MVRACFNLFACKAFAECMRVCMRCAIVLVMTSANVIQSRGVQGQCNGRGLEQETRQFIIRRDTY